MSSAVCQSKPFGDFGKVQSITYQGDRNSYTNPLKLTAQLFSGSDVPRGDDVTLWIVQVTRECFIGTQFAYVDPETKSLMFVFTGVNADVNGNPVGNVGLGTFNDDGIQINKLLLSEQLTIMDFQDIRRFIAPTASDGSEIRNGISFGNGNNGLVYQKYEIAKEGGKRKTKRSKKSKRHTRR